MARITSFGKQTLNIFICFCLVYTPFLANASAAEKWELIENVYDKSRDVVKLTATKVGQAANSGVYKVNVPVSSATLGSSVKSLMWSGIAVAGVSALVEGIGWIIDTGGQVIKRPLAPTEMNPPNIPKVWCYDPGVKKVCFQSLSAIVNYWKLGYPQFPYNITSDITSTYAFYVFREKPTDTMGGVSVTMIYGDNPYYDPTVPVPETEYEIMSDTELGEIIKGNNADVPEGAPDVIPKVYNPNGSPLDTPASKESDKKLDAQNPEPETPPKSESETVKEKDENGEETGKETTTTTWPSACEWFPSACVFFKVSKENQEKDLEQNKTFFEKVSDWFDWTNDSPDLSDQDTQLDIEISQEEFDTEINFGGSCPAPLSSQINFMGLNKTIEFSFDPVCQIASFIKPVVISISAFSAALIVAGIRTEDD